MRLKDIKLEEKRQNMKQRNIIIIDDEQGVIDSISVYLKRAGFNVYGYTDPVKGIEAIKKEKFDLLILDFLMTPLHGDQVVEKIREFDDSLYIILLTGHKDLAPPLETIKRLQIQGYCEKSDKFDQMLLLVESGIKSVEQYEKLNEINEKLRDKQEELEQAYMETIEVLRGTVEAKDIYTVGHSERVSKYALLIGKKIGLSEKDLHILEVGSLFHDIGKIGIPDYIITKAGKLSVDEYSEIKNHPSIGEHILSNSKLFKDMIPIVLHHHERWDGKGYPKQLKGEKIPPLARIAAVADSFDAMTSRRSYRDELSIEVARDEIEKNIGTQFSPIEAQAMLDLIDNEKEKILEIKSISR